MADQTPEIFVPYAAAEATEAAPGVLVRVTGLGEFPGKGPDRRHDTGAYLKVTCEQGSLAAMIADLDGYIERRADEIAGPIVGKAAAAAANRVDEARGDAQRWQDVNTELGRRLEALQRLTDQAQEARDKLARALGYHPAGHHLPLLVDEVIKKLEATTDAR